MPQNKKGRTLSEETKQEVVKFFQDDEVSRICPGAKDFVSVPKEAGQPRVHEQKRLLLANLRSFMSSSKRKLASQ